jgi:hypothetical protein
VQGILLEARIVHWQSHPSRNQKRSVNQLITMKAMAVLCGFITASGLTTSAVTIGQVDNFEDGTTQNWVVGLLGQPHAAPPSNAPTGGPAGVDDNFLQLTSLGASAAGSGSRLAGINFMGQWAGNYVAAGVSEIAMDVRNLGATDLFLRLAFSDPTAGPPANVAFSTTPVVLPAGGDWTHVVFPLADLTSGIGSVPAALGNTTELRIYHSTSPNFPNPVTPIDPVMAVLGVDNIEARGTVLTVPDGGATLLFLGISAFATILAHSRRSR